MSEPLYSIKPPEWKQPINTNQHVAHWFGYVLWVSHYCSLPAGENWFWEVEYKGLRGRSESMEQAKAAAVAACRKLLAEHLEQVT